MRLWVEYMLVLRRFLGVIMFYIVVFVIEPVPNLATVQSFLIFNTLRSFFWFLLSAGWDVYAPSEDIVTHMYVRKESPKFWETVNELYDR